MKKYLISILIAAVAPMCFAAVDGVAVNKTTGKPQGGVTITLLKLGAGMDTAGSTETAANGSFKLDVKLEGQTPYLLQAVYEGVTYSKMLAPGGSTNNIEADVFSASPKPVSTAVTQDMILLEPSDQGLAVSETVIFQNTGNVTFNNTAGTLRFYAPAGAGDINVQVRGPGGMPIGRPAEKGKQANEYTVDYAIKPGETTFNLAYTLPATKTFEAKILHGGGPVRLVVPKGVTITGDNLTSLGAEPKTQASIYEVKGTSFKAQIEGTGSLRQAAEAVSAEAAPQPDDRIEEVKPRVYGRLYWVLGSIGIFLACGFALLYRSQPAERKG